MIWSFYACSNFFLWGYPLLIPTAFVQTLLLEETVHIIQYDEGWSQGSPYACLFPTRRPRVLERQSYNCKLKVLRTNSVVLDSRHRKDQLDLDRYEQTSNRKIHLCETTPGCTNNITAGTTHHHYLEMGPSTA